MEGIPLELRVVIQADDELVPDALRFRPEDSVFRLFQDLIQGKDLPLTMVVTGVDSIPVLIATSLFLARDLLIQPAAGTLAASAELVGRTGWAGLAHVDPDIARWFILLNTLILESEVEHLVRTVHGWVRAFLAEGVLPNLPPEPEPPRIVSWGTNGFVVAEAPAVTEVAWVDLFRQGALRGVIFCPGVRNEVLAACKSPFLEFDLRKAAQGLNEAEEAMGEPSGWVADDLWLRSPPGGTLLTPLMVLDVLVRV